MLKFHVQMQNTLLLCSQDGKKCIYSTSGVVFFPGIVKELRKKMYSCPIEQQKKKTLPKMDHSTETNETCCIHTQTHTIVSKSLV